MNLFITSQQPFQREIIRGIYGDADYWAAVSTVLKKRRASQQPAGGARQGEPTCKSFQLPR